MSAQLALPKRSQFLHETLRNIVKGASGQKPHEKRISAVRLKISMLLSSTEPANGARANDSSTFRCHMMKRAMLLARTVSTGISLLQRCQQASHKGYPSLPCIMLHRHATYGKLDKGRCVLSTNTQSLRTATPQRMPRCEKCKFGPRHVSPAGHGLLQCRCATPSPQRCDGGPAFSLGFAQAKSEPSSATTSRSSSSFAMKLRVNLTDRSSARRRSFNTRLASSREGLTRLPPAPQSSEKDELQAVLSVHSVPHSDSRSSFEQELGRRSPAVSFDFDIYSLHRWMSASTSTVDLGSDLRSLAV